MAKLKSSTLLPALLSAIFLLGLHATAQAQSESTPAAPATQPAAAPAPAPANDSTATAPARENSRSVGGLFIEPGITYESGKTVTSYPILGDSGGTNKGFGLMGRLGFHLGEVFFVAADARFNQTKFSDGRIDANANGYQVGPVVGLQTPIVGLRVWGEYVAMAQLDPDGTNNFDVKFKNGTGWTIGAGLHLLAISVNLEYQKLNYATTEVQAFGPFNNNDTNNMSLRNEAYIASVSFPLEL